MMKSKKGLSGVLAVLMLVSMLACFVLPATAENIQTNYYVSSAAEWNAVVAEINAIYDAKNKVTGTIHIQKDISFVDNDLNVITLDAIESFNGTLDGNGYKFTNITQTAWDANACGARLIKNLNAGAVIQDLTLDASCTFKNTSTSTNPSGAFASSSNGGTIRKCASYATYINSGSATAVGGFVGKVSGKGVTIDGCIFGGTVTNGAATANAFIGTVGTLDSGAAATVKNSLARGTLTAANIGTDAANFENTYAVLASGSYGGNATVTKTDLNEAVWIINDQRERAEDGEEVDEDVKVYLNVDENGNPCFGDINNRVVRVMYDGLDDNPGPEYYAPRSIEGDYTVQTRYAPQSISGKVWNVSGAERRGNYFYVGNSDITVSYVDADEYNLQQARAQLQAMVDAYQQMNPAYFTDWEAKQSWVANAEADLDSNTLSVLQGHIDAEKNIDDNVVEMTEPEDYPSVKDYNNYKYIDSIKNYKVEDAADWKKAVELSNHVETPNATNFSGITLHLIKNIDMNSAPMKPLCYGGFFDGNLDGHDYAFENIKIEIDSPYGPVGLIGVLGETEARKVQNLGIESGSIKVTGWPRFKYALKLVVKTNIVGGFVGKNYVANSLIRKCRNNADISVENGEYIAGILGEGRTCAIIDSCINEGHTGLGGYGVLGYGHNRSKTYNSMSGAVDKTAVGYHGAITGIVADDTSTTDVNEYDNSIIEANIKTSMEGFISNVSGVKSIVDFSTVNSKDASVKKAQQNVQKPYNFTNGVMSSAAAGWTVNTNYQQQELGDSERIYYTLDANGDVRFGEESNQIYRIKLICDQHGETCIDHPTRYAYGIAGREITLGFDVGANYYACANEKVTINGNVLTFSEEAEAEGMTFTVYVGYDADRGNVNGDLAINVLDALDAVRLAVKDQDTITKEDKKVADVDSNYVVNVNDAYRIICCALKLKGNGGFTPGLPAKKSDYLKVASYNIKGAYYNPNNSDNNQTGTALSRKDEVLAELNAIDADIIGFQEIVEGHRVLTGEGVHVLEEIYEGLSWYDSGATKDEHMHYVSTREYNQEKYPGATAGDGIISKYPIIDKGTIFFKGMPFPDDPAKHLDQSNNRAFTWAKIDVDENEKYVSFEEDPESKDIIFYFYHLATESDAMAAAELQYIIQHMKEHFPGDRVVGVGDLNLGAYHTKAVLDKVNDSNNSYTALNGGDHHNTYARTNPYSGSMIDNIIISDNLEYFRFSENRLSGAPGLNTRAQLYVEPSTWETWGGISTKTVGTPYEGKVFTETAWTASDHMPIWAYIKK